MHTADFTYFVIKTNPGITGLIIADSFRHSRLMMDLIYSKLPENKARLIKRNDQSELKLENGSRLFCFPKHDMDKLCGFRFEFIIDLSTNFDSDLLRPFVCASLNSSRPRFIYREDADLFIM